MPCPTRLYFIQALTRIARVAAYVLKEETMAVLTYRIKSGSTDNAPGISALSKRIRSGNPKRCSCRFMAAQVWNPSRFRRAAEKEASGVYRRIHLLMWKVALRRGNIAAVQPLSSRSQVFSPVHDRSCVAFHETKTRQLDWLRSAHKCTSLCMYARKSAQGRTEMLRLPKVFATAYIPR